MTLDRLALDTVETLPNAQEFDRITDPIVDGMRALFAAAIRQTLGAAWLTVPTQASSPVEATYGHPVPVDMVPSMQNPHVAVWRVRDQAVYQGKNRRTVSTIAMRYALQPTGDNQIESRFPILANVSEVIFALLTGNLLLCIEGVSDTGPRDLDVIDRLFGSQSDDGLLGWVDVDRTSIATDYSLALPVGPGGGILPGPVYPNLMVTFNATHDGILPMAYDADRLEALRELCVTLRCGSPDDITDGVELVKLRATAPEEATDECAEEAPPFQEEEQGCA